MTEELDFDLRKLNPEEGDLVLLINRDDKSHPNLLAVFDKFIDGTEAARGTAIRLSGAAQTCNFDAKKAAYLLPCLSFGKINLPQIKELPFFYLYVLCCRLYS